MLKIQIIPSSEIMLINPRYDIAASDGRASQVVG